MIKRGECEKGKHKFNVLKTFDGGEDMIQLLQCQDCQRKFWGYGGEYGNPKWVHAVSEKLNPLRASSLLSKGVIFV